MPQKKINRKANNDIESRPLLCMDRGWYSIESGSISGDMGWSFEEMEQTLTKDPKRLRDSAVNCLVSDRQEYSFEEEFPIYVVMEKETDRILEIVAPGEFLDDRARSCICEEYGQAPLLAVPAGQDYVDIEEVDRSMERHNAEKLERQIQIARLLEAVRSHRPEERVPMAPITVQEMDFNAISWRTGMDGGTYYVLGKTDGADIVGMDEDRMYRFLDSCRLEDLSKLAPSLYGKGFSPDIEDLLYREMTVGGDAIDFAFVSQCTEGYSKEQMGALKTSLQTRLAEFYDGLRADGHMTDEDHRKSLAGIDRDIQGWLGAWPLLAGKMDCRLDAYLSGVTERVVSDVAERAMAVNRSFRTNIGKWAVRQCRDRGLDSGKLSVPVRKASQIFANSI